MSNCSFKTFHYLGANYRYGRLSTYLINQNVEGHVSSFLSFHFPVSRSNDIFTHVLIGSSIIQYAPITDVSPNFACLLLETKYVTDWNFKTPKSPSFDSPKTNETHKFSSSISYSPPSTTIETLETISTIRLELKPNKNNPSPFFSRSSPRTLYQSHVIFSQYIWSVLEPHVEIIE